MIRCEDLLSEITELLIILERYAIWLSYSGTRWFDWVKERERQRIHLVYPHTGLIKSIDVKHSKNQKLAAKNQKTYSKKPTSLQQKTKNDTAKNQKRCSKKPTQLAAKYQIFHFFKKLQQKTNVRKSCSKKQYTLTFVFFLLQVVHMCTAITVRQTWQVNYIITIITCQVWLMFHKRIFNWLLID